MYSSLGEEFAKRFCEDAVEFTIDMMAEVPNEYQNYQEAKKCVENAVDSFSDVQLQEYLDEFCTTVKVLVAKKKVKVKEIAFTDEGFSNCSYDIE